MAEAVREFFAGYDCTDKRILLLVPDHTRLGPVGQIFQLIYDCISRKVRTLDVLVALGTHHSLTEEQICGRLEITLQERRNKYASVRLFNHKWKKPETFKTIGVIGADEIHRISEGRFREPVNVSINKLLFDYDEFFIIGPVLPHESVGFSGGHKYIFPGIAEGEIINFFHWLCSVITIPHICGNKWTPPRKIVEKAASFINIPRKLFSYVFADQKLKGLYIGGIMEAWEKAVDLSARTLIVYKDKPYRTILAVVPQIYDDMWIAGKAMYKLEPVLADGGTLIIYAPHITELSYSHGKILDEIGYHTLEYFLKQMDKFANIPRGILAHSTNIKGLGTYRGGVEKPRANVILATGIPPQRCEKINLGYMNPTRINIADYENKETEGILLVHHAGEKLHRLANGFIPSIPKE